MPGSIATLAAMMLAWLCAGVVVWTALVALRIRFECRGGTDDMAGRAESRGVGSVRAVRGRHVARNRSSSRLAQGRPGPSARSARGPYRVVIYRN